MNDFAGWEPVIGLEVHVQLRTASKIFCGCPTTFGAPPNRNTCPVCLGHPGVLPVLNRTVVDHAVRVALATGATIAPRSVFARKNYFYPDLPKGYQISQYDQPFAEGGGVELPSGRRIGLVRIHLEEDAGKLLHEGPGSDQHAFVDYNRAGVPLVEIVSKPEIESPAEARSYLESLHALVTSLGVCDGNMEEGSLRCDANVSVRRRGAPLGVRAEIKNLNSFRFLEKALHHEIARHADILEGGGRLEMDTRGWDAAKGITYSMRSKEDAHDYRYFPEPDLMPLQVDPELVETLRRTQPELPTEKRRRLVAEHGIAEADALLLASDPALTTYFEEVARASGNARAAANWVVRDVLRELKEHEGTLASFPVPAVELAQMIRMIDAAEISSTAARDVFLGMKERKGARQVVAELGLGQLSDRTELEAVVRAVISENPAAVESYRAGKQQSLGFLVGTTMKRAKGRANPKVVNELLLSLLAPPEGR